MQRTTIRAAALLSTLYLAVPAPLANAADCDIAILSGRVMDPETNFDAVRNVCVKGGKIAGITEDRIAGKETIEAEGHVVAPGFMDTHHHGAGNLWGVKASLRDGVTTPLDLELGVINVDAYYAERDGKWPVNFGAGVSHEFHRMRVLDKMPITKPSHGDDFARLRNDSYKENDIPDWAVTQASLDQMNEILADMDEDLRAGGLGIVSTTGYMGKGVTTLELFNVQKVAANYGRLYASHVRLLGNTSPPTEGTLGAFEQIANGVALNQPLILSHNNNAGWWEVEEHLQLLRKQGYNVWSEYYPYTCGSSTIGSEFIKPDNIGNLNLDYTNLIDPRTGKKMNRNIYDRIVAKDPAYIIILCIPAREEWLPMWLKVPHMTVAGDQMPPVDDKGNTLGWDDPFEAYNGHPRSAGTHAKTHRLARELGVRLMQVLAQNSYWTAKHLGDAGIEAMKLRGRMQEGMVADIVVFDPKTVTDNAGYKVGTNGLPSTGIPFVIVNGVVMVENSKVQSGRFPGRPIRYPVEKMGRFKPLEKAGYLTTLLGGAIPTPSLMHGAGRPAAARRSEPKPKKNSSLDPATAPSSHSDPERKSASARTDWFGRPPGVVASSLLLCPIHRVRHDKMARMRNGKTRVDFSKTDVHFGDLQRDRVD